MGWLRNLLASQGLRLVGYAFALGLALGTVGGVYAMHVWHGYQEGKVIKDQVDQHLEKEGQNAARAMALELELQKERAANRSITQRLQHEIANNASAYRCPVPADGMRLLREAVAGPVATSERGRALP